jgi:phosphoribosylanthranilate isomerase
MKIKVCGMRDAENIEQLIKLPIDYIGFIFYDKSKRFVGDVLSDTSVSSIPDHIKKVGVFVNSSFKTIKHAVEYYGLDMIQLHGDESADFCKECGKLQRPIVKAFGISSNFDFSALEAYKKHVDFFLFDTSSKDYGGTGTTFNWAELNKYDQTVPFFLSGGLSMDNIEEYKEFKEFNIHALDLNSKFEVEPGLKNIEILQKAIEKVLWGSIK